MSVARITFVNRYFFPDHSATSQLLGDLAFHLAESGQDVAVVTGRQVYDDPDASLPASECVRGVRIRRLWTSRFGRSHLLGRTVDYLTFYLSAAWFLASQVRRGDVVVAETDPPLISVVAAAACWVRGAVLVNWVHDIFPEIALALDVKGIGSVAPVLRLLRDASLKRARINVVLGELMADRLRRRGVAPDAIRIIPNWADGDAIQPLPAERIPLRRDWGLDGQFVIGYSGNMGRAHEFATLLGMAEALGHDPRFAFVLIGDGADRSWIEDEIQRRGLDNVKLKPYQPRDRLLYSLGVADLHAVSLIPSLEGLIVPSKVYGALAAGRPVLFVGDPEGEVAKTIRSGRCGAVIAAGDVAAGVAYCRALAGDRQLWQDTANAARATFENNFEKRSALDKWRECLKVLAQGHRAPMIGAKITRDPVADLRVGIEGTNEVDISDAAQTKL